MPLSAVRTPVEEHEMLGPPTRMREDFFATRMSRAMRALTDSGQGVGESFSHKPRVHRNSSRNLRPQLSEL